MKEADKPPGVSSLSGREREVVALAAQGLSDKEIAARLEISIGTLGTYWARVRTKLGLRWRTEIVANYVREHFDGKLDESVILDAVAIPIALVSNTGAIDFGNRAFWSLVEPLDGFDGVSPVLAEALALDDGEPLETRLGTERHFAGVATLGRERPNPTRVHVRAWPIAQRGQWVLLAEPLATQAAVLVDEDAQER